MKHFNKMLALLAISTAFQNVNAMNQFIMDFGGGNIEIDNEIMANHNPNREIITKHGSTILITEVIDDSVVEENPIIGKEEFTSRCDEMYMDMLMDMSNKMTKRIKFNGTLSEIHHVEFNDGIGITLERRTLTPNSSPLIYNKQCKNNYDPSFYSRLRNFLLDVPSKPTTTMDFIADIQIFHDKDGKVSGFKFISDQRSLREARYVRGYDYPFNDMQTVRRERDKDFKLIVNMSNTNLLALYSFYGWKYSDIKIVASKTGLMIDCQAFNFSKIDKLTIIGDVKYIADSAFYKTEIDKLFIYGTCDSAAHDSLLRSVDDGSIRYVEIVNNKLY